MGRWAGLAWAVVLVVGVARAGPRAVVVEDPALPQADAGLVAAVKEAVKDAGYEVVAAGAGEVGKVVAGETDLLVIPSAPNLPVDTIPAVSAYLKNGNAIVLGGAMWSNLVSKVDGRYLARAEYDADVARTVAKGPDLLLGPTGYFPESWKRAASTTEPDVRQNALGLGGPVLQVSTPTLTNWDTISIDLPKRIPATSSLFCLRALGGPNTTQLAVELDEEDGSRWIATIPLSQEWHDYALPADRFKAWQPPAGRGGPGDLLHFDKAVRLSVGVAFSHTDAGRWPHRYSISAIGHARHPFGEVPRATDIPAIDLVSPGYEFYSSTAVSTIVTPVDQGVITPVAAPVAEFYPSLDAPPSPPLRYLELLCLQPRPRSSGVDKHRPWRWQPLLEARGDKGEYRGTIAALLVRESSAVAAFTPLGSEFYTTHAGRRALTEAANAIRRGMFLREGGADFYTYFADQKPRLGARVAVLPRSACGDVILRIKAGDQQRSFSVDPDRPSARYEVDWTPAIPEGGMPVTVELSAGGRAVDRITHTVHVDHPPTVTAFLQSRDGGFFTADGKPWKAHGINYMPSSGIGLSHGEMFEHWLSSAAYDPEVIERDLSRVAALGFNAVSVFIYRQSMEAHNLLDFLRRCREHGLRVNLSLRPGTAIDYKFDDWADLIAHYRLAQNDTVFAYDLAWEACHWDRAYQAKHYTADWRAWLTRQYGTPKAAETAWGVALPRERDGAVGVPAEAMVHSGEPSAKLALDYRAFLDELLAKRYGEVRDKIRAIDPNHAVSFRMNILADPTSHEPHMLAYDPWGLRHAVDIWEPEAYGRIGDLKPGIFSVAYCRLADPAKPVVWSEAGYTVWDATAGAAPPARLTAQANFYRDLYAMLRKSGSDGVFFWWYPGGYRMNERTDFGVINPDGTDRPVTAIIREEGPRFLAAAKRQPEAVIKITRGPRGAQGAYDAVRDDFWRQQQAAGRAVRLEWQTPPAAAARGEGP